MCTDERDSAAKCESQQQQQTHWGCELNSKPAGISMDPTRSSRSRAATAAANLARQLTRCACLVSWFCGG